MNRSEYLVDLTLCLKRLPDEERQTAVSYYKEYFDEAGAENEQSVIKELGSPGELAERILREMDIRERRERREKKAMRPGTVLLWILASPLLIPLFAAAFSIFVALLCVAFSLILVAAILLFVPWIVFVALAAYSVFMVFCTAQLIFMHPATAVFFAGTAATALGLALIIYGAFRRPFVGALRFVGRMFTKTADITKKTFRRRRNEQ